MKIAVVSTFTLNRLPAVLEEACKKEQIEAQIKDYTSYNLCAEEIVNKASDFNQFAPDLLFLFIDLKAYIPNYLELISKSNEEKNKIIAEKVDYIRQLAATFSENNPKSKLVVHNFEIPTYSPLGILDNKIEMGLKWCINELNRKLEAALSSDNNVYVFDYDGFISRYGKKASVDQRFYFLADLKLVDAVLPELAHEYGAYIKPIQNMLRKCIVLDLDNTLWGGIVGEDGFDNIKLGPKPPGNAFVEFQKIILSLFKKGIILAINSKNNPDEALRVVREHPQMVLREKHFSAMRINWQDKATNMKEIADELNIGMDSIVFIDDDRLNRLLIRSAFPEVLVVDLPEDPSFYPETIMGLNDLNTLQLTETDKSRGNLYAQERQRRELKNKLSDFTSFLKELKMKVELEEANSFTIPRIAQLTNRTNQFNLTTKRYSVADIQRLNEDDNVYVCSVKATDKLGDNGIVGCSIIKMHNDEAMVDTFLMSCRIIGRQIEKALLTFIIEKAKSLGAKSVTGEYIPTKKNIQTKDFYKNAGFSLNEEKSDGYSKWGLDLTSYEVRYPEFIEIRREVISNE